MKKTIALLLIFFGLYSTIISSIYTYGYLFVILQSSSYQSNFYYIIISWLLVIIKFLKTITLYLLSHYGASSLFKLKKKYASNLWLYIGLIAASTYFLEYIFTALPLVPIEEIKNKTSFLNNLIDLFIYNNSQNIPLILSFSLFFVLFFLYKKDIK